MSKENIDTLRTQVFGGLSKLDDAVPALSAVLKQIEEVSAKLQRAIEGTSQPEVQAVVAAVQAAQTTVSSTLAYVHQAAEATKNYIGSV